jgi:hypothetical protein
MASMGYAWGMEVMAQSLLTEISIVEENIWILYLESVARGLISKESAE